MQIYRNRFINYSFLLIFGLFLTIFTSCGIPLLKHVIKNNLNADKYMGITARNNPLFEKAVEKYFLEDFDGAKALFEKAFTKCQDMDCKVNVSVFSAINYIYLNDYANSRKSVDTALKINPNDYLANTINIALLYKENKYNDAINTINNAYKDAIYYRGMDVILFLSYKALNQNEKADYEKERIFLTKEYIKCNDYNNFSIYLMDKFLEYLLEMPAEIKMRNCQ